MTLPLAPPYPPMEALSVEDIPTGPGWQYEPKWDGFRCLVFRDGASVELQSKSGQPLARYFPEVVEHVRSVKARSGLKQSPTTPPARPITTIRLAPSLAALIQSAIRIASRSRRRRGRNS